MNPSKTSSLETEVSELKNLSTKIPVMVARDQDNQTVDGILKNESAEDLCRHLNGRNKH